MASSPSPDSRPRTSPLGRILLALALVSAALVGTRDITNEASVSLQGDMPRYLMNGVFLRDFAASDLKWPPSAAMHFAEDYYARYPALSLGHHPPLLPVSLVPFFAVFGISVAAARLAIVVFFLSSVIFLYLLVRRAYDATTAGWACLLFASSSFAGWYGQRVLSEIPALCLVLATMAAIFRFRETGRTRDYCLVVVTAILSLGMRQLAVFVFPAYAIILLSNNGWRHFLNPRILIGTSIGLAVVGAVAVATLILSPFNVSVVRHVFANGLDVAGTIRTLGIIGREQIGLPLLLLTAAGIGMSILAQDRRIVFVLLWIAAVLAGVIFVTGAVEPARYSALAFPAYCVAGASLWCSTPRRSVHVVWTVILLSTFGWQLVAGRDLRPVGASGYEQAATFVVGQQTGPTVLFSGSVDTGYFVFFVRKHDPDHRLVVLRSDKILTTSLMGSLSVEDRISNPDEIYAILQRFGTRFIVIEDHPTGSRVLDWLREQLHTSHFAVRARYPVESADRRLQGVDVVVYEYLEATPAAPDATLDLKLPLVGREIRVRLSELQGQP
jgi:hypothetical protein